MAFDHTYVTQTLSQAQLHGERALVGGAYGGKELDQSFLEIDESLDMASVTKASQMLETVVWDAAATCKLPISVCSVPMGTFDSGPGSSSRGAWNMLSIMNDVLQQSGSLVRAVIFDAHGSHSVIRKILHGEEEFPEELAELSFWREITYKPLPESNLPRMPVRLCYHKGEPLYGIPGVCTWACMYEHV